MDKKQQEKESTYYGVDLSSHECRKLIPDPIYSKYKKEELHYPIGAIQKGLKPHTKIGIKRIEKRNQFKKIKLQNAKRSNQDEITRKLNPKSPQEICMKALRKQFRQQLEKNYMESQQDKNKQLANHRQNKLANNLSRRLRNRRIPIQKSIRTKQMSQGQIKRKEHQKNRRLQLNALVKKYKPILVKIFGPQKFRGYGRCPKISRQQIWKALNFTTEEANIFYQKQVLKLQKEQKEKNQDENIDIKLLRLSTHKFTTTIQFYASQQSLPLTLPYPFPNNEIYINLNSTSSSNAYQFYPTEQQKQYLTRYVISESLNLVESNINVDTQYENENVDSQIDVENVPSGDAPLNFYINPKGCFPVSFFTFKTQKFYIEKAKKQIFLQVPFPNKQIYINVQKLAAIKDNQMFNIYQIVAYHPSYIPKQNCSEYIRYVLRTDIILHQQKAQHTQQQHINDQHEQNMNKNGLEEDW